MTNLRAPKFNTVNRKKRRMDANAPVDKLDILTVDSSLLDDRFEYFWCDVNKPGNLQKKQAKDWDIVYDVSGIVPGDDTAGKPVQDGSMVTTDGGNLVLMSKKKEWCVQDRKKMEEHLQETEKAIREDAEKGFEKIKE